MIILSLFALTVFVAGIGLSMYIAPVVSAGAELDGITTLIWGTAGVLQSPLPSSGYGGDGYYIVESIDSSEDAEQIYGENGTGIKCWRMTLTHGRKYNITVTDDSTMTPPSVNTTVTIVDQLGDRTKQYVCKVLQNEHRGARKQPGQRVLQVESLTLIDPQP